MSAPDYDDPKSKLKLRLRPMNGSGTALKWGSVLGVIASLIPGVQRDGSPLWLLLGAAVFAGQSGFFYLGHKLVRRLR